MINKKIQMISIMINRKKKNKIMKNHREENKLEELLKIVNLNLVIIKNYKKNKMKKKILIQEKVKSHNIQVNMDH